jgi:hypothetical protein
VEAPRNAAALRELEVDRHELAAGLSRRPAKRGGRDART